MISISWYVTKLRIKEILKYELKLLGIIPNMILFVIAIILFYSNKQIVAYKLCGEIFRTNWFGCVALPNFFLKLTVSSKLKDNKRFKKIVVRYIEQLPIAPGREKFIDDPSKLLGPMIIVVRQWTSEHKGILIIKYSYYFPIFLKFFNAELVATHYHIVLEPSWAGYFDLSILSFCTLSQPVFVMTYEERDKKFIETLDCNLKTIDVGPNWWVDFENFKPEPLVRDIDVIMIASWSSFKRHYFVLKAFVELKKSIKDYNLKAVFVGYDGDISLKLVKKIVAHFDLNDNIEFYEHIPTEQVANLLKRSKVNLLWSRFEGNNRSIIEGLFCDTPVVLKKGHNFGYTYPYINSQTGLFATEAELPIVLENIINHKITFSPRNYVLRHHNYNVALQRIEEKVNGTDKSVSPYLQSDGKINQLWGMSYLSKNTVQKYSDDYAFLKNSIVN